MNRQIYGLFVTTTNENPNNNALATPVVAYIYFSIAAVLLYGLCNTFTCKGWFSRKHGIFYF